MPRPAPVRRAVLLAVALGLLAAGVPGPTDARSLIVAAAAAAPTVTVHLRAGAPADALRVPAEVRWSGVSSEPVRGYRLQRRVDGGAWTEVALADPNAERAAVTLASWRVYAFRVAARSTSGNLGPWIVASRVRARQAIVTETAASYPGMWQRTIAPPWLEGATRWTRDPGASVRFS